MPVDRTAARGIFRFRSAAMFAALVALGACGGSDSTPPTVSEAGTYQLTTVNGQSLPVTITGTALGTVVIQSATVVLTPGTPATFTANITGTENGGAATSILSAAGTYARSGSTLTFSVTGSPIPFTGSIASDGNMTVGLPGAAIGTTGTLQLNLSKS